MNVLALVLAESLFFHVGTFSLSPQVILVQELQREWFCDH